MKTSKLVWVLALKLPSLSLLFLLYLGVKPEIVPATNASKPTPTTFDISSLHLPSDHVPYFLNSHPRLKAYCVNASAPCNLPGDDACWGHEDDCLPQNRYLSPRGCAGDSRGWASDKIDQETQFFEQGDFGYLRKRLKELATICAGKKWSDSSLICSQYTRFCRGRHLYIDLRKVEFVYENDRFRENLFSPGQIGGFCDFDSSTHRTNSAHKSALQSWYAELESFTSLPFKPSKSKRCDVRIDKPTFFVKLDAAVNMFHHFCDFVNLYMTQHLNGTFDLDINILMWDTSQMRYLDPFEVTWKAFSKNPLLRLSDFAGKRVCFSDFVMGLLPRMRYGHFYNMPLVPGCSGTGLYKAFSHHVLHRLGIPSRVPRPDGKIVVTILERRTKFRNIVNQVELVELLRRQPDLEVRVVYYNFQVPFLDQLRMTYESDIFIGLHGAGLTHLLFLPDWGVVFELYSCDDEDCYANLARLRGVHYVTWEKEEYLYPRDEGHHPTLGPHKKFTDYGFDPREFLRLVRKAVDHVKSHEEFVRVKENFSPTKEEL